MGWSVLAAGQISGQFYLEKSTFAPGEPIFLYFKVVNDGPQTEHLHSADPYSFCSGYQITVSSDPGATSSCAPLGFGGSCLSSTAVLPSGRSHIERLLVNFDHKVDAPGQYSVAAERQLDYAHTSTDYFSPDAPKNTLEVHTTLYFQVDANASQDTKAIQAFVGQLRSDDPSKRREAARTLATIAPRSLQDALLAFAENPEFRQFAPLAFYHLHTPRSMKALADLLEKTEVGSYEHIKSADYLAESGESQWFPLLEDVARKHAQISNYVDDAAELGGDRMLPTLIALTHSSDREFALINAVTGMGYTGSRAAVPILIDLLRNSDTDIGDRARFGLKLLTHRTTSADLYDNPQSQYPTWSQWWAREGTTAPVYKATECGDFSPLP
jgi:hypothetical protein